MGGVEMRWDEIEKKQAYQRGIEYGTKSTLTDLRREVEKEIKWEDTFANMQRSIN